MRALVVQHQMRVELRRYRLLDGLQEAQEFLGPVPSMQLSDHVANGDVQSSKQHGRAMAAAVMGAPLEHARHQRRTG